MSRLLQTKTLDAAAKAYAENFVRETIWSTHNSKVARGGRDWALQCLVNGHYKDEFDILVGLMRDELGKNALADFDKIKFKPRDNKVFAAELANRLAITPAGEHIEGKIGRTVVDSRKIGQVAELVFSKAKRGNVAIVRDLSWNIYAGEEDERARPGGGATDPIPDPAEARAMMLQTTLAAAVAIVGLDAVVDAVDGGSAAGVIQIRSDSVAQPADPDATQTGVLLGTLVFTDPAYLGAVDAAPNATATAQSITDDASADATGTADHFRKSSSNDGATPLLGILDGDIGTTASFDLNLNTAAIVSGATISITADVVTFPQS